ncbi:MAG: protein kinase [Candidatus Moeniiplasma glomeromycotorum]|nr:protein kinase [Candidatus Moeniiplasma glomeromycotorum]MCE8167613.1 protein kinase [Candidatus Moeniiplasma glomeromycotorum]MCE8169037.1 protein kinase [Candidatus Moeniiplasma glomeromycotorum]
MVNAQEWLDKNYRDKKWTKSIYLNQQLEGILDCGKYKELWVVFISSSIDRSKLEIKKFSYYREIEIVPCISAQTYLDQEYLAQKEREKVKEIEVIAKGLEGNLDLSDFKNLEKLDCSNNCLTNLNLNNCKKLKEIRCWNNQLATLNLGDLIQLEIVWCSNNYLTQIIYPTNLERMTELLISDNNISFSDLSIFSQFNNLVRLEIGNRSLFADKNKIDLGIYNRFMGSLEPLKYLNNLEDLDISNTDIDSGWEYLPNSLWTISYDIELRPNCKLVKVQKQWDQELWKDIHNDFSLEYKKFWLEIGFSKKQTKRFLKEWNKLGVRPQDIKFIDWFLNFRKLDLNWALENEEEFSYLKNTYLNFRTCERCQQPNTSEGWCQSCNAKHFREDFPNWTSDNTLIDKFIQKCQLEATSDWNVLEWIPYEKFTDIEYIATGGFGKIEKAYWWGRSSIEIWDNKKKEQRKSYKVVVLKTLSNSQNLNQDFLKELTLYKMFKSEVSQMVPCYGVSKDGEGNYIMVMKYMNEGNLREFLKKNYWGLNLYDRNNEHNKLYFIKQITQGLKDIHRKKLVHCDFHSGNVVIECSYIDLEFNHDKYDCRITDLGLSRPINEEIKEGEIYGLIPYMAPEVLRNKPYTQKSDIYSLGMIMYEIITGLPPFVEQTYDTNLALQICQGIRP